MNIGPLRTHHPLMGEPEGMASLIDLARRESGELPVGCSGSGGYSNRKVAEASDVILIHGDGCSRQRFYNLVRTTRSWDLGRPIVCNKIALALFFFSESCPGIQFGVPV